VALVIQSLVLGLLFLHPLHTIPQHQLHQKVRLALEQLLEVLRLALHYCLLYLPLHLHFGVGVNLKSISLMSLLRRIQKFTLDNLRGSHSESFKLLQIILAIGTY